MADDKKSGILVGSKLLASMDETPIKIVSASLEGDGSSTQSFSKALRRYYELGAEVDASKLETLRSSITELTEPIEETSLPFLNWSDSLNGHSKSDVDKEIFVELAQELQKLAERQGADDEIERITDQPAQPETVSQAETVKADPPWFEYPFRLIVKDGELDTAVEDFLTRYEADLDSYGPQWARIYQFWDALLFIGRGIYKVTPIARLIDSKIKHLSGDQ